MGLLRPPPPPLRRHLHNLPPLHRDRRRHTDDRPLARVQQVLLGPRGRDHVHAVRACGSVHQLGRGGDGRPMGHPVHAHRRPVPADLELRTAVRVERRVVQRTGDSLCDDRADVRGRREGPDEVGGQDCDEVGDARGKGHPPLPPRQLAHRVEEQPQGSGLLPGQRTVGSELRAGLGLHDGADRLRHALRRLRAEQRPGHGEEEERISEGDLRLRQLQLERFEPGTAVPVRLEGFLVRGAATFLSPKSQLSSAGSLLHLLPRKRGFVHWRSDVRSIRRVLYKYQPRRRMRWARPRPCHSRCISWRLYNSLRSGQSHSDTTMPHCLFFPSTSYHSMQRQVQSWTPQLVTGPLNQTPPNKLTEVFWGMVNCYPTLIAAIVIYASEAFRQYQLNSMITWLVIIIVSFAVIFAINSSIHSFLVVKYAKSDKVAVSVGFYYMSNALGRLVGTLGSGFIYTYAGGNIENVSGYDPGSDGRLGLAACFLAGTISSLLAAVITIWIKDEDSGFKCRHWTIVEPTEHGEETNLDARGKEASSSKDVGQTDIISPIDVSKV
ncbi:hypothetical protein ACHAWF_002787 [Thalassiosira exigua]